MIALASSTSAYPRATTQTVQVWLAPRLSAAEKFATAVSTPGSAQFHDFLTPDGYAARFGATAKEASTVTTWLRAHGFSDVAANPQRDYVSADGSATRADTLFGKTGAVPEAIAADAIGVTGLDATTLHSTSHSSQAGQLSKASSTTTATCSTYWGQYTESGLPAKLGTTTFSVEPCGYTGAQLRSAYGETATNTGAGQTIAIALPGGLEPQMLKTLSDFAAANGLPAPSASRYHEVSLKPASCTEGSSSRGEEQMDIEAAYSMAPGADFEIVGGDTCDDNIVGSSFEYQSGLDTDLAIVDGNGQAPLATVASDSDEYGYDDQSRDDDAMETAVLVKGAAVGVGIYYSAGDQPCVAQPASNPYATDVGATELGIDANGDRLFETGSGDGVTVEKDGKWGRTGYFGLGGGESLLYPQPAYQKGVVPASMSTPVKGRTPPGQHGCVDGGVDPKVGTTPMRSAPDISAEGNPGMLVGVITGGKYGTLNDADTSLSAPLVAGMVVAAEQGQAKPFGFINPALYKLAGTSAFFDPQALTAADPVSWRASLCPARSECGGGDNVLFLTDDQGPSAKGWNGQVTTAGYDNTTGLGVPNGQAFITAIRALVGGS